MKKLRSYIFPIFILASTFSLFVFVSQVSAVDNSTSGQNTAPGLLKKQMYATDSRKLASSEGALRANKLSGTPPFGKIRLEINKLRICQQREKNIVNRSNNMVRHANHMIEVFDSISTRIQNYYLTKLVPQGKVLPNYDALVLEIQTNKNTLAPLLETVKTDVANFKCDGDDPKGQLDQFKEDMQAVIVGLKTFKTSVRNLIVAVNSIGREAGTSASGSATVPVVAQ